MKLLTNNFCQGVSTSILYTYIANFLHVKSSTWIGENKKLTSQKRCGKILINFTLPLFYACPKPEPRLPFPSNFCVCEFEV